jgi:hypothetical protein
VWPFKKKIVKEVEGAAWGYLVTEHNMDVDTLSKELRCVQRDGVMGNEEPVTFLRVFKPSEAAQRGIEIEGWETLDEHHDLVHFEGYIKKGTNEAYLEQKMT